MWRDHSNHHRKSRPPKIIFFALVAGLFIIGFSVVVMFLWNAILPDLLGVNEIHFWQAAGLLILSRILFGGFPFSKSYKNHTSRRRAYWKDKWMNLSEEEKSKFKARWKDRC